MVSDQEIANSVENLLRHSDPNAFTSLGGIVQHLEAKLGLDLSHKTGFIRDQIELLLRSHPPPPPPPPQPQPHPQSQPPPPKDHFALQHHPQFQNNHSQIPHHFALQQQQHQHQQQHQQQQHQQRHHEELNFQLPHPQHPNLHPHPHPNHSNHPPSQPQPQPQPQSRSHPPAQKNAAPDTPKESAPAKKRGGAGGLNKVCGVSPELQAIVGEPTMPRTEIVKQLWAYIRKNNLQDPSNKRKIICNDELRLVFETDCTDMFKMNKLLSKHIIRLEPATAKEPGRDKKRAKVEVESASESTEADSSPVIISDALAKFFGSGDREMLQSEALRRVWEYIRVNCPPEDPMNSKVIICDAKLQELFGCESISLGGVTEMVGRHLFKQS